MWDWAKRELIQSIELAGPEGQIPLEVRFMHRPDRAHAFVGTALGSAIYHLWREEPGPVRRRTNKTGEKWGKEGKMGKKEKKKKSFSSLPILSGPMRHQLVASIPAKRVSGWALEWMPALITDILLSMDDRFLYVSCWLHGDIRQYDITEPSAPRLVGQVSARGIGHFLLVRFAPHFSPQNHSIPSNLISLPSPHLSPFMQCFLGGSIHTQSGIRVLEDSELQVTHF